MVKWTIPAKSDLKRIHDYIAQDSAYYAKSVITKIISKTKLLNDFPEIDRIVPELGLQNIREIIIYSYRIIYEISNHDTAILTVIHGKCDFESTDFKKKIKKE